MILSLFIFIRIISNSLANVYQKKLTISGFNPNIINFIMYGVLSCICLPCIFKYNLTILSVKLWVYAILGGFFGAMGNTYLIKALENGELSVLGPINAYKSVIAMLVGIVLLKEIPSVYGIAAVALIVFGSYFVFDTQEEGFSFDLLKRKDIKYRFFALFLTAIEAVCIKNVINNSDILISFILWCIFGMIFCGLFSWKNFSALKKINKSSVLNFTSVILCMGLMQLSTNYVFSRMQVSYGLALFQLSALVSVILGWKFFNESQILKKLSGTVIMIIGAAILILYK